MASMPGYKSKSTTILLDEEATTLDFILEPEGSQMTKMLETECDCSGNSKSRLEMADIFAHPNLEVSLIVIVVLVFLFLLLRRRLHMNLKQRPVSGPKRATVV